MNEPAISWWAPHIIAKRNQVISKIKSRYRVANHKYGVIVPRNIDEAYRIDHDNGDNLWRNAIAKEMGNIMVAFKILGDGEKAPPGYTKIEQFDRYRYTDVFVWFQNHATPFVYAMACAS